MDTSGLDRVRGEIHATISELQESEEIHGHTMAKMLFLIAETRIEREDLNMQGMFWEWAADRAQRYAAIHDDIRADQKVRSDQEYDERKKRKIN